MGTAFTISFAKLDEGDETISYPVTNKAQITSFPENLNDIVASEKPTLFELKETLNCFIFGDMWLIFSLIFSFLLNLFRFIRGFIHLLWLYWRLTESYLLHSSLNY